MNTKSSTKAELVGVDDVMPQALWTRYFIEAQGYTVKDNIVHQDNQSAILLETNGQKSSSKRTRALNIRYFFLADQVGKGNLEIRFRSTAEMWGDFMTKPLQGKVFKKFLVMPSWVWSESTHGCGVFPHPFLLFFTLII